MKLSYLLEKIPANHIESIQGQNTIDDPEITSIHLKAQDVKPNGLFIAIKGGKADGNDYIDIAVEKGAAAIITQMQIKKNAIIVQVENTRKALSEISARFYDNPSEKLVIIGITGTNGKTTTAYLIESILLQAGINVGVIGTINYRYAGKTFYHAMTTPESIDLQRILDEMLKNNISHVVMEVSSHAIDLNRINCCMLDIAVFTNLTQDHLDYHKNMDTYWQCKKKMFTEHLAESPKRNKAAVINCENQKGKELFKDLDGRKISVGTDMSHTAHVSELSYDLSGIKGSFSIPNGKFDFMSSLVGQHNAQNIACATGVGIALNIHPSIIKTGIEKVTFVPGRLEMINNAFSRYIYVDYAHTPDALEHVLSALKLMSKKKLICVFGCGGDRDKAKRPIMGSIAGKLCDLVIITSDNPRTENPLSIIDNVAQGVTQVLPNHLSPSDINNYRQGLYEKKKGYVIEPDRKKAILLAVTVSTPEDTIIIAGKGHETYQIIGNKKIPFDDGKEARKALQTVFCKTGKNNK
jgi:UDP-N-acetylmuramyl-tripeptide synthetase